MSKTRATRYCRVIFDARAQPPKIIIQDEHKETEEFMKSTMANTLPSSKQQQQQAPPSHCFLSISVAGSCPSNVVIELFQQACPQTCRNFVTLCCGDSNDRDNRLVTSRRKPQPTYRGSEFHRIVPGFMAQGGDFERFDGTGGYSPLTGGTFRDESFQHKHNAAGIVSMANKGKHTNGSQFFITLAKTPHLDQKHVVFGKVVEGMNVVESMGRVELEGSRPAAMQRIVVMDCGVGVGNDNSNDKDDDSSDTSDDNDDGDEDDAKKRKRKHKSKSKKDEKRRSSSSSSKKKKKTKKEKKRRKERKHEKERKRRRRSEDDTDVDDEDSDEGKDSLSCSVPGNDDDDSSASHSMDDDSDSEHRRDRRRQRKEKRKKMAKRRKEKKKRKRSGRQSP